MKPKTMILMGLAIVCGLGASYMTSRLLADRGEHEKDLVKVLVAKKDLSIGTPIRKPEELFEEKHIPKESDTPDAIREYEHLKDKVLKQSRNKGDTVTNNNLLGKNETLDVPEGHEAVGLKISLETSASGLATLPGSRVNLIWFQRGANNETSRSDYLLEDVLVLAADGKVDREGLTAVAQVVTLALSREQVVRVNLAKETGIINLTLRRHGDPVKAYVPGILGEDLRKEIADRNKTGDKTDPTKQVFPRDNAKTDVKPGTDTPKKETLPQVADGNPKVQPQPAQKTTKQELTIIEGKRVQTIIREIAEDGTIVSEVRREDPLPALNQPAPRPKPNVPSIDA